MNFASDTTVIIQPGRRGLSNPQADRTAAQAVVRALVEKLAPPADPLEHLRYSAIAEDLMWLDGDSVADLLDQPVARFGGAYGQLSAYALVLLAEAELNRQGLELNGRERLLQIISEQAEAEFVDLPKYLSTLWLVPATAEERTAAYIGSLLLNRAGEACRPWLSSDLPDHGHFLILAAATTNPEVGHQVAHLASATHHRCDGVTHLAHLAVHALASR